MRILLFMVFLSAVVIFFAGGAKAPRDDTPASAAEMRRVQASMKVLMLRRRLKHLPAADQVATKSLLVDTGRFLSSMEGAKTAKRL